MKSVNGKTKCKVEQLTKCKSEAHAQLLLHCRRASCWADCPSACTSSWQLVVGWPVSPASVWLYPSCPAARSRSPAQATNRARDKWGCSVKSQIIWLKHLELAERKHVVKLHSPHPNSHDAQLGCHFAARLWLSHPHQPCVISPSPTGGEAGNLLRKQRYFFFIILHLGLTRVHTIFITETVTVYLPKRSVFGSYQVHYR